MNTLRTLTAAALAVWLVGMGAAADGVERPLILGVAHIAFRVSDLSAAEKFYRDVLGLPRVNLLAPTKSGRHEERSPGKDGASLNAHADCARYRLNFRQEIVVESGLQPNTDERLSHLAFETSDLAALTEYFKARTVPLDEAPHVPCVERNALWVKDPDGHIIEFVQREPGATRESSPTPPENDHPISTRVLHAGLTIRDAEAADRFYHDVLGFSEFWRGGGSDTVTNWINMKVPNGTDYLEYMLVSGTVTRQRLGSAHHVALLVPDIQAAYETAMARTPANARQKLASPNVGRNGRWQLNLFDPDGSRVELMEPSRVR